MHSSSEVSFNLPRTLSVNQVSSWAYQAWECFLVLLAMSEREASTMVTQWCLTVASVEQFRPRQCLHRIAWPGKPTTIIIESNTESLAVMQPKLHRFEDIHAPPHTPRDLSRVWWNPHHVWYGGPSLASDRPCCFTFPDCPLIME